MQYCGSYAFLWTSKAYQEVGYLLLAIPQEPVSTLHQFPTRAGCHQLRTIAYSLFLTLMVF